MLQTMEVMKFTVRKMLYAMQQILQTKEVMMRPETICASAVGESRLGVNVQENFQVPGMGWSEHNLDSTIAWHVQPVWGKTNFSSCIVPGHPIAFELAYLFNRVFVRSFRISMVTAWPGLLLSLSGVISEGGWFLSCGGGQLAQEFGQLRGYSAARVVSFLSCGDLWPANWLLFANLARQHLGSEST